MAAKRMFSLAIVDTDLFLDMSASAQNLYFHLGMRADDDGFVSSPKRIMVMCNASDDDMKILIAKGFIIPMNGNGVCVITHWKINNLIRGDRYTPTLYQSELDSLSYNNGAYYIDTSVLPTIGIPVIMGGPKTEKKTTEEVVSTDETFSHDTSNLHTTGLPRLGKGRLVKEIYKEKNENHQLEAGEEKTSQTDLFGGTAPLAPKPKEELVISQYQDFITFFNQVTGRDYGVNKDNLPNFKRWLQEYSVDQMKMAVKLTYSLEPWWKDKLTPARFLRTANKNGPCDNIGDVLNKHKGKYELDHA